MLKQKCVHVCVHIRKVHLVQSMLLSEYDVDLQMIEVWLDSVYSVIH